jgi:hypothetical protein
MKRHVSLFAAIAAIALATTTAFAGAKWSYPVTISTFEGVSFVGGQLGSARASADTNQFLGCESASSNTQTFISCFGRNAAGVQVYCYNRVNAGMRDAVAAITPSSYISFQTDPADGTKCAMVQVQTSSAFLPPTP